MNISIGFIILCIYVLIPGLIFRRLYFYGEFSKQFSSGYNIFKLLFISSIPGFLILFLVYLLCNTFIFSIDLDSFILKISHIIGNKDFSIKELLHKQIAPFLMFLYSISILLGLLSGRFVSITRLDTKFKLLRFKNYWFYLFTGKHTELKRIKCTNKEEIKDKKWLFTVADILIDTNSKPKLYSGIIADYELLSNDCRKLNNITLIEARRYGFIDGKSKIIDIPGHLFVIDCSTIKNINLTYIYTQSKIIIESKLPQYVYSGITALYVLLIPFYIIEIESIDLSFYENYFNLSWYKEILIYLISIESINVFNPYLEVKDGYKYIDRKTFYIKVIRLIILLIVFYLL